MKLGLRVDVDTFRGTRDGVPALLQTLAAHGLSATFFFTVGPDNMGRHLWRLLKPRFFVKMLRSNAPNLYGWDIIFRGTLWPGPLIGKKLGGVIRATANAGHEVGFHAWDHHEWQTRLDDMDPDKMATSIRRGIELLEGLLGGPPSCSACAAWKCNDETLLAKSEFPFRFNSDCRGHSLFYPVVNNRRLDQIQIPTTLPTFDELIGRDGVTLANYNARMLDLIRPGQLNVLTVHAEVEGGACSGMFNDFLTMGKKRGIDFVPLGLLVKEGGAALEAPLIPKQLPGREGWLACQGKPPTG